LSDSIASGRLQDDLAELTGDELEFLRFDWELWARDEQLPPLYMAPSDSPSSSRPEGALFMAPSDRAPSSRPEGEMCVVPGGRFPAGEQPGATNEWRVWMLLGGRGSGKTRAGAEWVRAKACDPYFGHEARIALVGKTLGDVRSVMIEGVSGLLAIHPERERPLFESSKRQLTWPNGAIAQMFGADEADQLRGPQFTHAWCDELAKWYRAENAWDMLQFALRLGETPQAVVTTTPKPLRLLKKIMEDFATVSVKLATADNEDNLAPAFLAEMNRRYAGSALGRQELLGDIVEDAEHALWRRQWIEEARIATAPELVRVVVALDPPVTSTAASDACGIVVAALGIDKRAYVLADLSLQGREPDVWARAALAAYDEFGADAIIAEVNQGGDLIAGVLHQFRENVPVTQVRATRGKYLRAEPIAALYAQGRVAHVGRFQKLEDQMCAFGPDGKVEGRSPDRVDALVWAMTDLLLSGAAPRMRVL
jgi:phage terminase large subunit-like protein